MQPPVKPLKNLATQAIPVPGGVGGMVGLPVAFDAQQVAIWLSGVENREVQLVAPASHLGTWREPSH